jgi:hypothetical protein
VPEQLRNSSLSLLSDPRGEVSPVIVAKATLPKNPSGLAKHISGYRLSEPSIGG